MLLVFLTMQYGKLASYLYCKWQAEMVQKLKDCGCETHLAAIFSEKSPLNEARNAVKEIAFEYQQNLCIEILFLVNSKFTTSYLDYKDPVLDRSIMPAFRPPAA